MNNRRNIFLEEWNHRRDKIRKKEALIAELTKIEAVNCRNVHVTKEKEDYILIQGLNIIKLEKNTLSELQNKAVPIDEVMKYPKNNVIKELNILKEDDNPKEEAIKINPTNCPNVTTTEILKLKKNLRNYGKV